MQTQPDVFARPIAQQTQKRSRGVTGDGAHVNLRNFRRREWHPAIEAAGIPPRRIYDLRSTFASNALAAGVSVFKLARIMGTSVRMIERHYGTLLRPAAGESEGG